MTGGLVESKSSVLGDFPGGPVVKNPPSNIRDVKSIPSRGTKIPHAAGQLNPRAATPKPTCSGVHNENPEQPIFFNVCVWEFTDVKMDTLQELQDPQAL